MAQIGLMIEGQEGLTWDRWRRLAGAVDRLGYESLWRSDHLVSLFGVATRPGLDTWPSLTYLAAATQRIRFGPLVCPITFRHPAMTAREAAAVDVLSGGRLELGLGAGWHEGEHRAFGIPYPRVGERIRRLDEAVQVIQALWAGGPARFEGRYYRLEGGTAWPKPVQRPCIPLVIGGKGPKLLEVVARYADEWNCGGGQPPARVRERTAALEAACRRAGRDPATIRRSWMGGILIGEHSAALERRARALQEYMVTRAATPAARLPHELREAGWLVGTPEDIVGQMRALCAEGISRFNLQFYTLDDLDAVHLIAEQVIPAAAPL
jgi:F420-dependent oxidoreductase-like protein